MAKWQYTMKIFPSSPQENNEAIEFTSITMAPLDAIVAGVKDEVEKGVVAVSDKKSSVFLFPSTSINYLELKFEKLPEPPQEEKSVFSNELTDLFQGDDSE